MNVSAATKAEWKHEARLEGAVAALREEHKDCPPGIDGFRCNLRDIDEVEIDMIIAAWKAAK